jgi:phosphoribosylamine--glycine ligase
VVVTEDPERAVEKAEEMLTGRAFGAAGHSIVVEEMLRGHEASYFVLSDGAAFVELATCQDYKRAEDGDRGPNTGGMGAYSPVDLDDSIHRAIRERIVAPTIEGLAAEGRPFKGVLYVGLMLTADGPRVVEYNARFGDPEAQVLLPRLDGEWAPLLLASAGGRLEEVSPRWKRESTLCVVMTSRGYPGRYAKGQPIHGLAEAEAMPGVVVFHAATEPNGKGGYLSAGGRVLGVTATASELPDARALAYAAVARIGWEGEHHRSDIALDAIQRLQGSASE